MAVEQAKVADQEKQTDSKLTLGECHEYFYNIPTAPILINEFEFCTHALSGPVFEKSKGTVRTIANIRPGFGIQGSLELISNGRQLIMNFRREKADRVKENRLPSSDHQWKIYCKKEFLKEGEDPRWVIEYWSAGGIDLDSNEGVFVTNRNRRIQKAVRRFVQY